MKDTNLTQAMVAAAGLAVGDVVPAGRETYRNAKVGSGVERTGERTTRPGRVTSIRAAGHGCSFQVATLAAV